MITDSNIGVLILTGRGPNYSNFQILTTDHRILEQVGTVRHLQSNNVNHSGAIYKAQRMGIDFWPIQYIYIKIYVRVF